MKGKRFPAKPGALELPFRGQGKEVVFEMCHDPKGNKSTSVSTLCRQMYESRGGLVLLQLKLGHSVDSDEVLIRRPGCEYKMCNSMTMLFGMAEPKWRKGIVTIPSTLSGKSRLRVNNLISKTTRRGQPISLSASKISTPTLSIQGERNSFQSKRETKNLAP